MEVIKNSELVDVRSVKVDKQLCKDDRIAEYARQIKDPHHYRCGKFTVSVRFTDTGPTMEECLLGIVI